MSLSGLFTIHEYRIPFRHFDEPVYIIPFGDIHRSSELCHEEKFKEFCAWAAKKKRAYFLGMGDYLDLVSASERDGLTAARLHESTIGTIEKTYRQHTDSLIKELSFARSRTLGLIEGNHHGVFQNGTTTTQRMCEGLDCKYLGSSSFIRVIFEQETKHSVSLKLDIWAYHGKGAARLVGGSLNTVQQMAEFVEADVLLAGHDHKKSVGMIDRLRLTESRNRLRLSHRKIVFARTGSFLRGYVPDGHSYVSAKSLNPTNLGTIKLEITPRRSQTKEGDIAELDVHCSI